MTTATQRAGTRTPPVPWCDVLEPLRAGAKEALWLVAGVVTLYLLQVLPLWNPWLLGVVSALYLAVRWWDRRSIVRQVDRWIRATTVDPIEPPTPPPAALAMWTELIDRVRDRKVMLAFFLEKGVPVSLNEEALEVVFENSYYEGMVQRRENLAIIREELAAVAGRQIPLRILLRTPPQSPERIVRLLHKEESTLSGLEREIVARMREQLEEQELMLLDLLYCEGLTFSQIAGRLGVTSRQAQIRVARLLHKISALGLLETTIRHR